MGLFEEVTFQFPPKQERPGSASTWRKRVPGQGNDERQGPTQVQARQTEDSVAGHSGWRGGEWSQVNPDHAGAP